VRHSFATAGNSAKLGCRDPAGHALGGDRPKVADVERVYAIAFHFRRALQLDRVVNAASDPAFVCGSAHDVHVFGFIERDEGHTTEDLILDCLQCIRWTDRWPERSSGQDRINPGQTVGAEITVMFAQVHRLKDTQSARVMLMPIYRCRHQNRGIEIPSHSGQYPRFLRSWASRSSSMALRMPKPGGRSLVITRKRPLRARTDSVLLALE
jgi:hypothetical protein